MTTAHRTIRHALLTILSGGLLPFNMDFSTKADGALPSPWQGSTWQISSGAALNSPTLGAELLTDPGLEATYTAGKCNTLTLNGTPTLAQSADAHGGTKAQQMTATAFNNRLNWPTVAGVAGQWYQYGVWAKRTAGATENTHVDVFQTGQLPGEQRAQIADAAYTRKLQTLLSTTTNAIFCYAIIENGSSGFSTVIADDGSLKAITYSSLFALLPRTRADVIIKAKPSLADHALCGIIARASAQTDPTHAIFVFIHNRQTGGQASIGIIKKVGSTYTAVLGETAVAIVAGAWLEVRLSGSSVSVYYNDVQVGTTQTIGDAELLTSAIHGLFSSGGTSFTDFFAQAN